MSEKKFKALIIVAAYNCLKCGTLQRIDQQGSKVLVAPTECPNGCEHGFKLNMIQSDFADPETGEYYGEVAEDE